VAGGQKKASAHGWSIVLIDESGFMLQPVVRRTWAPRGQTPIQYSWDRRDRLSVISAITIPPQRQRLGLYFRIHEDNVRFEEVMAFLTLLHRRLRRKFIVVLDRLNAHRKGVRLLQEAHPDWFEVEWLPPYAPDLNPVEMVWNHTKYADLANFIPDDIHHLRQAVTHSLDNARSQSELLRSFFRRPRLEL
jgi:transposase